ncbi:hypothetical protein SAMN05660836_02348 [Thermodesulforhabdus norvegica]|uniref:Putative nickel insertion protein n=2 Tax=Thermodesulforhabdus norvegica TaxID=39841 RepID=A0A1I4VLC9_9BACT|nr:hypothetical protein SAMN05660836_02348 [Thermodesulforhabdus norvegica]
MLLGAVVDAGVEASELFARVEEVTGPEVFDWRVTREKRGYLWGTRVIVEARSRAFRSYGHIREFVEKSLLEEKHKRVVLAVFEKLAAAEAKIHNLNIEDVHFHELGSVDTVVDVIGTVLGMDLLGITSLYASPLPMGRGFISSHHGLLPGPAPATLEVLKGVPVYGTVKERELVTPTGASLLAVLCRGFGEIPPMRIDRIGYGVGTHEDDHPPNLLRLLVGIETAERLCETLVVGETNIDDMNPEFFSHLYEQLFTEGAQDVWIVPSYMKKNRPGWVLSVLCSEALLERIQSVIFRETTSSGMRWQSVRRFSLKRDSSVLETPYGSLRIKVFEVMPGLKKAYPEYADCVDLASRAGVSVREIYEYAMSQVQGVLEEDL